MNNVLVSVLILTYNSAETIYETLESVYSQTYENIELIISDDGSTDNTVSLVNNWIPAHRERFFDIKFREGNPNVGVSKNFNLAVQMCSGVWVKPLGADDILLPNCISDYMKIVDKDESIGYYLSNEILIDKYGKRIENNDYGIRFLRQFAELPTAEQQYKALLLDDVNHTSTCFIRVSVCKAVGGCDEKFRNYEDYILRLRVLKHGYKIGCLEKETVAYRVHNSISHSDNMVYNVSFIKTVEEAKKIYCYPYISKLNLLYWISEIIDKFQKEIIIKIFNNEKTASAKRFLRYTNLFKPRHWRRNYSYKVQDVIKQILSS